MAFGRRISRISVREEEVSIFKQKKKKKHFSCFFSIFAQKHFLQSFGELLFRYSWISFGKLAYQVLPPHPI
jgi:hypothetical protein